MRHRFWAKLAAAAVFGGLAVVILGVFMATVWVPDRTVTSTVKAGDTPLVVTAPGFMAMNGDKVAVAARSASGAGLFLGVARTADVNSYLADAPRRSVIGLTAQSAPITTDATGPERAPAPGTVDIWVQRSSGAGSAALTWAERPGSWSLVVASDGEAAADAVTFTWVLPPKRSAAPPVIAFGVLLIVSGAIGLALTLAPARMDFAPAEPPVPVPADPVEPVEPWKERTP